MLRLPCVAIYDEVPSTLDVAHSLGQNGAEAGTLVLADSQSAGRGRMGRSWRSDPAAGIWLTLIERPPGDESLGVLALRLALALAPALDDFIARPARLKWPNDVYAGERKLAGVLIEARWRGALLDWLAVGVGINVQVPPGMDVAGLKPGTSRVRVLQAVVPALRDAVAKSGTLTDTELEDFAARDLAVGRRSRAPADGLVVGIDREGALLVDTVSGRLAFRAGSLELA